jgi:DNA-binding NarL/FixJ family response regulator
MTTRVVVAEDQALVRAGLVTMLESDPDLVVVGEAADGAEAVRAVTYHRPDVALVDVRMPVLDGLEATRRIRAAGIDTKVIVLTTFGEEEIVLEALRSGADTFLLKDTRPEDLLAAVHAVTAGESRIDPAVTGAVLAHFRRHAPAGTTPAWVDSLTPREREVLLLVSRGLSNAEIAAELVVSPGTVKTHVASLLAKMGVRDRVQAVVAAYEAGLMQAR